MKEWTTFLKEKKTVAADTVEFHFKKPDNFEYQAGQHVFLQLPHLDHDDPKGPIRTFTLSSAPSEHKLAITTRLTGSGFKKTLYDIPSDTELVMRGPRGEFVLYEEDSQSVFIAGGIGVTPFLSILQHEKQKQFRNSIVLLYSNRTLERTAYHNFFSDLQDSFEAFTYIPTLTEGSDDSDWSGETRLIDKNFIEQHVSKPHQTTFYLCGPPSMVDTVSAMLKDDFDIENIRSESFYGY